MLLDRLHINGFKSFSDRAELAFDHGVTAIVGPNGCGKSNVADAITWVLGEQSAKSLRGNRMEDVIFSGSDGRKPGATAEVRLYLTGLPATPNDTVPELEEGWAVSPNGVGDKELAAAAELFTRDVEVTRRLYRSGESEYLIDGETCRLRDVHELLMDTGLGAKAYAIIEQDKIGMILSSRPADRRQLIEEAAGITKYKARRRAAELKLEAAQQNLTRIDDIVFEVQKQRGALKRQSAKARRYKRLREELRRWEKVLFARRYRELARTIESARDRLREARERETAAAARLAGVETDLARLRIEQAEVDSCAAQVREDAHARELDIRRREQQKEFNRHQAESLAVRVGEIAAELTELEARREPARLAVATGVQAVIDAKGARDAAAQALSESSDAHARSQQQIKPLESDVESERARVFATLNSVMAVRQAMEHATSQRERVGETLAKLDIENDDVRHETETAEIARTSAADSLYRAHVALEQVGLEIAKRESELVATRTESEACVRTLRSHEQALARSEARLSSLVELEASRGEFGDAARMVLVQANGRVGQLGAIADYLNVDRRYERAVEACLGELLQHVIVERHDQAEAGLALVREQDAGRCGFVVIDPGSNGSHSSEVIRMAGVVPVSEVLRVSGPHVATIMKVVPEGYVADTFEQAIAMSRRTGAPVATLNGDVLRGPHVVSGGTKSESRGILATKREIKELQGSIVGDREGLTRMADDAARLEIAIAGATSALEVLTTEQHRQQLAVVGYESAVAHAVEEAGRLVRKTEVIALERQQAEAERAQLDVRHAEAEVSIERLLEEQQGAETHLSEAQCVLTTSREAVDTLGMTVADARAVHAAMIERVSGLEAEVSRLEDTARDVGTRTAARGDELEQTRLRREYLLQSMKDEARTLDDDLRMLEECRSEVRTADEAVVTTRVAVDAQDVAIREARGMLEEIRANAGELAVAHATAESDLSHLGQLCTDAVQCSLDQVLGDVEAMELAGESTPDAATITADESDQDLDSESASDTDGGVVPPTGVTAAASRTGEMTAAQAIDAIKGKIDRLGPVNMMAIEQFDELESRHVFLTTQRTDLVDSIAQTSQAIKRIDETSKVRFSEAFAAIQQNFQLTFSTLFGGGRAGLALLDEDDPLESGIDIVASPPGKRLQSVQLLSGGEKALTAIALMFAIFRFKPSPFCLLDEIDAPLDDANVGRFVDMLRGMLDRTQFILITHNRRTMEIANRLYGVTMEEPGVSKLISVQLN